MIKKKLKKIFTLLFAKRYFNSVGHFNFHGYKVFFPKNSHTFFSAVYTGTYEEQNLHFLMTWAKVGTTVFDIGANIGLMALPLLKLPVEKVISIEASPFTFEYLAKTHGQCIDKNKWTLINKAVGKELGVLPFYVSTETGGTYDSFKDTHRVAFNKTIDIDVVTLDSIWNDLEKPRVSLIKIDIEGADLNALLGGADLIEQCKPAILMEWVPQNLIPYGLGYDDLIIFLNKFGYNSYLLPGAAKITGAEQLELATTFTDTIVLLPA